MQNNPAGPGVAGNLPATNNANAGVTAGGWPNAAVAGPANPSRYNPPTNPPAVSSAADPRSMTPTNPDYSRAAAPPVSDTTAPQYPANAWQTPPPQNSNWQPQDTSWQTAAGQNPAWSNTQPMTPGGLAIRSATGKERVAVAPVPSDVITFEVRGFVPSMGVPEDPVTGSLQGTYDVKLYQVIMPAYALLAVGMAGAAGWLYRAGLESILGLTRRGDTLHLDPCIPPRWPGFLC